MSQGQAVELQRLALRPGEWDAILRDHSEATVFHGSPWLGFLASSQDAEPVVAAVTVGGRGHGYFAGAITRRYGVRILGSPAPGWATPHMGFLLDEGVDRRAVADALVGFAFGRLGCHHVELDDQRLTVATMAGSGWCAEPWVTYAIDLTASEDEILGRMNTHRRQYIRRALRRGLVAEVATDTDFADEHYAQLLDVFTRQGIRPAYGVDTVRDLIRCLQPAGQLLMLRVRGDDGQSVASMLSVGDGRTAVAWGAALLRDHADLHPMELLWWDSMRRWRDLGATRFDLNGRADYGRGDYKAKYGGDTIDRVRFFRPRYPVLLHGREAFRRFVRARQAVLGGLDRRRRAHGPATGSPGDE